MHQAATAPPSRVDVAVVVPTRDEAGNVAPLLQRLDTALGTTSAEILVVDDSSDDTPARVRESAASVGRVVRLIHREPDERAGGLGSAVLAGLRATTARWAVVIDGDLQHPPELVPRLVEAGEESGADVVVASRYTGGGSASGLASASRGWVSSLATRLAKVVFPRRLRRCSDPMSGFFAVRLSSLQLDELRPRGFKVLLEILARSSDLRVTEEAFAFQLRTSGESKASWREGALLVRRLLELRLATLLCSPRLPVLVAFGAIGVSGIAVNSAALWALVELLGWPLLLAATIATQVSTTWNFVLSDRLVFRGAKARGPLARFVGFALMNNAVLLLRLPLLSVLVHQLGLSYLIANIVTLTAAFMARFGLADRYLFASGDNMSMIPRPRAPLDSPAPVGAQRTSSDARRVGPIDLVIDLRELTHSPVRVKQGELVWTYDIHGIVTVGSVVRLKELDYFLSDVDGPLDIEIRPGDLGSGRARPRPRVTQYAAMPAVSYEEHLGRRGSDFFVDMTDNVQVSVGPMLLRSPHVLYTNVVEALLRFALVARGHMLLHSACLELEGRGVLLSALTDTGKTGTVLRLLRENDSKFLSDDMTILQPDGTALCYPKPLTISQHTLRAVDAGDLAPSEWRRLRVQSRLHSKEGRRIGSRLGDMNLPIMSLNAATQYLVPPPKYFVERLVPCQHGVSVPVEDLFVIERGPFGVAEIDKEELVNELIANTDDAYGFPPFNYFAPALVMGGEGYEELRARERSILAQALQQVSATRLASPDFSWADAIVRLAPAGASEPRVGGVSVLPTGRRRARPAGSS